MKRRQRHIALKLGDHIFVDQHRTVEPRAAVHDPVPYGDRFELLQFRAARPLHAPSAAATSLMRSGA